MLVKKYIKSIVITVLLLLFSSTKLLAASPSYSLYPNGGTVVRPNSGFIVDVMIDTDGEEILSAKFVLLFDPEVLQLTKAEKNNLLFTQWPEDESTIDNDNGVVMLSGFTQSGSGTLYSTGSQADIFARLHFKVLKKGNTIIDWEYGTNNGIFDTVMMQDGSPAQNILKTRPSSATFVIDQDVTNSGTDTDITNPNTGIGIDKYLFFTGIVLLLFGGFIIFTRPASAKQKKGTVVVYDDGEK